MNHVVWRERRIERRRPRFAHRSFATASLLIIGSCTQAARTGPPGEYTPLNAVTSSPNAEVSVMWTSISFTIEGMQLGARRSHGCHDTRARRCGTWQLAPGTYTFRITSQPVVERTETSMSIMTTPPQTIRVRLDAGHSYTVQRARVLDETRMVCWYADNAGDATDCRSN